MAFYFILGLFSVHHFIIRLILDLSLNFSLNSLNKVWFLAKNQSEFSLIFLFFESDINIGRPGNDPGPPQKLKKISLP